MEVLVVSKENYKQVYISESPHLLRACFHCRNIFSNQEIFPLMHVSLTMRQAFTSDL